MRLGRGQKENQVGDFLGLRPASGRMESAQRGDHIRVVKIAGRHACLHHPGRNRVDLDVVFGQLHGHLLGQSDDGVLGGHIGGRFGTPTRPATEARLTILPPRPWAIMRRATVWLHKNVPLRLWRSPAATRQNPAPETPRSHARRAVDQDIEPAMRAHARSTAAVTESGWRHIELHGDRFAPRRRGCPAGLRPLRDQGRPQPEPRLLCQRPGRSPGRYRYRLRHQNTLFSNRMNPSLYPDSHRHKARELDPEL